MVHSCLKVHTAVQSKSGFGVCVDGIDAQCYQQPEQRSDQKQTNILGAIDLLWSLIITEQHDCAHLGALHSIKSTNSSFAGYSWHSFYPRQALCTSISFLSFLIAGVSRQTMKSLLARDTMKTFSTCKKNRNRDDDQMQRSAK